MGMTLELSVSQIQEQHCKWKISEMNQHTKACLLFVHTLNTHPKVRAATAPDHACSSKLQTCAPTACTAMQKMLLEVECI